MAKKKKKKKKKAAGPCKANMTKKRVKGKGGKTHMQCVLMKGHKHRKKKK